MIPREILTQVRRVEFTTRGLVNDVFSGEYHSVFKGRGMNFAEVRAYQYGDDIRSIDWHVTARTGTPLVQVFDEVCERACLRLRDAACAPPVDHAERLVRARGRHDTPGRLLRRPPRAGPWPKGP